MGIRSFGIEWSTVASYLGSPLATLAFPSLIFLLGLSLLRTIQMHIRLRNSPYYHLAPSILVVKNIASPEFWTEKPSLLILLCMKVIAKYIPTSSLHSHMGLIFQLLSHILYSSMESKSISNISNIIQLAHVLYIPC